MSVFPIPKGTPGPPLYENKTSLLLIEPLYTPRYKLSCSCFIKFEPDTCLALNKIDNLALPPLGLLLAVYVVP